VRAHACDAARVVPSVAAAAPAHADAGAGAPLRVAGRHNKPATAPARLGLAGKAPAAKSSTSGLGASTLRQCRRPSPLQNANPSQGLGALYGGFFSARRPSVDVVAANGGGQTKNPTPG
jgi:hypothetical protein